MPARRFLLLLACCAFALAASNSRVLADDVDINVFINSQPLVLQTPPVVAGGVTLVPFRPIFEPLGASVNWFQASGTVSASWPGGSLSLTIGAGSATLNGALIPLELPARIISGVVYVPVRLVSVLPGARVGWYRHGRMVGICRPQRPLVEVTVIRVVAGDTLEVLFADNHADKVRLIGLGEPDVGFVQSHLAGQKIFLETDDDRDSDGRLSGYVHQADGTLFNALLLDEGYGKVDKTASSDRYAGLFGALENSAREGKRGRWAREESGEGRGHGHQVEAGPDDTSGKEPKSDSEAGDDRSDGDGRGRGNRGNHGRRGRH